MGRGIWERIEGARDRWDVLRHPFYQRWSRGELSRGELARYAAQYRHAVVAIAEASEALARALPGDETAARHAAEERDHVALWDRFAAAAGARPEPPTPETSACIAEWTAGEDALDRLARLYAIEGAQPAIASVKRAGLVERYGFEDGPATDYFRVHAARDSEHAAEARALISALARDGDADRLAAAAEGAFRANWRLLDGV